MALLVSTFSLSKGVKLSVSSLKLCILQIMALENSGFVNGQAVKIKTGIFKYERVHTMSYPNE